MVTLRKKLARDLWQGRWQFLSVLSMVTMGVAFLIAPYTLYLSLRTSYDTAYERASFESFGVSFYSAPARAADRVARIPGVLAVEGRTVVDAVLELPQEGSRRVAGRLVSVPDGREPRVNRLFVVEGVMPRQGAGLEATLESKFAKHHAIQPGDEVRVIVDRNVVPLRITGAVQSPEYVYAVKSKHDLFSTPDTFGVAFVPESTLSSLVGRRGQINEVRVLVRSGHDVERVMAQAAEALAPYRPDEAVPYWEQPSYQMLQQDVNGFRNYAFLFPALFLTLAATTIASLLARMVWRERPVIGLLRSLGASRWEVGRHYLSLAAALGATGATLGALGGGYLGGLASRGYLAQVEVPFPIVAVDPWVVFTGFTVGLGICLLAAVVPVWRATQILPAEALRPLRPTFTRHGVWFDALARRLPIGWRIPVRNLWRQPGRTLTTVIGVAGAVVLMVTSRGLMDSIVTALDDLFETAVTYDLRLDFEAPVDASIVRSVARMPGVAAAEGILEVPVEYEHDGTVYSALLVGTEPGSRLRKLRSADGTALEVDPAGVLIGPTVARRIGASPGSVATAFLPERLLTDDPQPHAVRVLGVTDEMIGTQSYTSLARVSALFGPEMGWGASPVGAVLVRTVPGAEASVRAQLSALPRAAAVTSSGELRRMTRDMIRTLQGFIAFMELFAVALAFGILLNMMNVNIVERMPEIATLRSIGMRRAEISRMLAFENAVTTLVGVALGLPAGLWFVRLMWDVAQTPEQQDLFSFSVRVSAQTLVVAAAFTIVASLLAQWPALRLAASLNLARAVKERAT